MMEERRLDDKKFATQKVVTYILLALFCAVTANVLSNADQSERSMVLQTVINITLIAVGYWLGSSKSVTEQQKGGSSETDKVS